MYSIVLLILSIVPSPDFIAAKTSSINVEASVPII
ncbi:hypothetical protein BH18THE2_BH18THE2_27370 [soil metagenome]